MKRLLLLPVLAAFAAPVAAKDPGTDAYMMRVIKCAGEGVSMEVYLPQSLIFKPGKGMNDNVLAMPPTIGWYTLDLSDALKGKPLEPVRVSMSADRKFLIVDQYTRGLKPTRIPVGGGTVDFDQRFGKNAKCGELNAKQ